MNIDITSFFFNSSIEGGTATCAWGTSIGQNATKGCRVEDEKPGVLELLTGMVYKSCADTSKLDISAGSSQRDLLICSIFDKVFVNGIRLEGCKFILTLVRELSPSHKGRLIISYPSYAKYDNEPINKNTIDKMATAIGCNATGCWFVHDISVRNQDELHFSSVVVDPEKPQVYTGSSSTRSKYWQSLVSDNKAYNLAELGTILRNMYDNAENGKQVAMLYVFVFQYGQYLVDVYKSKEIIEAAGLNGSYSTEIDKAYNVYRYVTKKKLQLFFNDNCCDGYRLDLKQPLQTIFYGAPGTGKSHEIQERTKGCDVIRTTFHPDSDYASFVGAYKPMMEETEVRVVPVVLNNGASFDQNNGTYKEKRIVYKYEPQVFLKAYVEAWKRFLTKQKGVDDSYYLVIEEINRGNCAQIFGDLFQLLDRENDGYSSYAISPESAITKYLAEDALSADGTRFSELEFSDVTKKREDGAKKIIATADDLKAGKCLVLPPNLHIWATMNTSDQSLFPIDSAFKRRWDWEYVPIKRADKEPENKWIIKVTHGGKTYWCYWWEFLEAINHQIEETNHSEDKQLGYFFAKPKAGENFISTDTFVNKVIFYLWNDVFKDEDSAVFQYDNEKVKDFSVNRAGTMYFRHFMENTDEMIHYFINQLFAMGKENNPVVPIDYLKNDADPKVFEYLPKMREDCEETPMPKKDKGEENAENDKVAGEVDGKSVDTCNFSNDTYKAIAEHIDRNIWMNDKTRGYFQNGVDVKFTDMPISYARFPITFDSSKNQAEIKLYIPSPSAYNKSGELYTYLKGLGVENIVQTLSTKFQFEWHELGDQNPQSNKVKGWALTLGVDYNNDAVLIANQIISLASEFFYNVDPLISSFINIQR